MTGEKFKDANHNTSKDAHIHVRNADGSEDIVFTKDRFSTTDKKILTKTQLATKVTKEKEMRKPTTE